MNVAEADVDERLQLLFDLRNVFQNRQRVGDRHFQQVSDGVAVVSDGQCLAIVTASAADFAQDINIGQKIHFDAALAFALAGLAASARDVKGKAPGLVAAL